jgi:hypothetical protein
MKKVMQPGVPELVVDRAELRGQLENPAVRHPVIDRIPFVLS